MSTWFRKDKIKRNYSERAYLYQCLGIGLLALLTVFSVSSLFAFYLFITYEVQQSIEVSYIQTL